MIYIYIFPVKGFVPSENRKLSPEWRVREQRRL